MNEFWKILTFLSLLMSSLALYLLIGIVKELVKELDEHTLNIIDLNKKIKQMEENKK